MGLIFFKTSKLKKEIRSEQLRWKGRLISVVGLMPFCLPPIVGFMTRYIAAIIIQSMDN